MLSPLNMNPAPDLIPFERYVLVPILFVFFFVVLVPALYVCGAWDWVKSKLTRS